MIGPVEALSVLLFLLGCYGLAIGILQVMRFVPLSVSLSFRFLGASGLGNIAGGLGALILSLAVPMARLLPWTTLLTVAGISLALLGACIYLSEWRRARARR